MKSTTVFLLLLVPALLLSFAAEAQHQSKENFERRNIKKKGFLGRWLSGGNKKENTANYAATPKKLGTAALRKKQEATAALRNKTQREQAEQIWLQQRKFREDQRKKQLNRKPTAWEIAYMQQEKTRLKELKKLLKERDKRIAARAKSKRKAMAAAAKYKLRKAKNTSPGSNEPQRVFSSSTASQNAGNAYRKK